MRLLVIPLLFTVCISHLSGCRTTVPDDAQTAPAHHTEDGFRNLYIESIDKGPIGFIKMKYFGDEPFADHPSEAYRVPIANAELGTIQIPGESAQLTWLGHSSFLIQYAGKNVLTDPILSQRASPVSFAGPKRLVAMPITLEDLPAIDVVVISHNHYDHLDSDTIGALGDHPMYLVPLGLRAWFVDLGINPERVVEMDWWDSWQSEHIIATATPSQHWSARGLFDRFETLWAAWHVSIGDFSFWFGGDTGYNPVQFKEVGERWPDIDLGLIPIGAYAPRWFMAQQHVGPEEALQIHRDIGAARSVGMHWGTFQLSAEPSLEPAERLALILQESELPADSFDTMSVGETRRYGPAPPAPSTIAGQR